MPFSPSIAAGGYAQQNGAGNTRKFAKHKKDPFFHRKKFKKDLVLCVLYFYRKKHKKACM